MWSLKVFSQSYYYLPRSSAKPRTLSPRLLHLPLFPSYTSLHLPTRYHQASQSSSSILVFHATCSVRPFTATASWWCCQGLSASLFAIPSTHFKVLQIYAQNGLIEIPERSATYKQKITKTIDSKFGISISALLEFVLQSRNRPFVFKNPDISR